MDRCPYYPACGGCQLQGVPYTQQLADKQRHIEALLGGFAPVAPILGMAEPLHYRNKVHAVFALDKQRHVVTGSYKTGSHAVVPVDSCGINDELCDAIILTIRRLVQSFHLPVYDERSRSGWLRHVLLRRGFASGQVMVVLVAASPLFRRQNDFIRELRRIHPEICTIVLNINDRFGPVVLGKTSKVLYGSGYIEDTLCALRFRISPSSFYQVNPVQTEKLYRTAIEFAALTGRETVLDAYCGIGTIGLIASAKAKQVIGVELNGDAVKDAIANAKLNGIKNAWFMAGDAGEAMVQMAREGQRPDVAMMDPPRSGSDETFLNALLKAGPKTVVYISCCAETLARDLKILTAGGYAVRQIQPVDMFPFTEHVETVVMMTKRER